jgi:hypothetical protein
MMFEFAVASKGRCHKAVWKTYDLKTSKRPVCPRVRGLFVCPWFVRLVKLGESLSAFPCVTTTLAYATSVRLSGFTRSL